MSLRSAAAHRNLLYLLSLKELRTRYKKSIIGWAWSLLNPMTQMVIFSIIFLKVFHQQAPLGNPSGIENFPLYFLCGLLPFNFFSISVGVAMGNVQGGAGLIKKVSFPHEHLVFSVVIAQFVTMLIEFLVLSVAADREGNMVLAVDPGAPTGPVAAVRLHDGSWPWRSPRRTCSSTTSTTCGASLLSCCSTHRRSSTTPPIQASRDRCG